MADVLIGKPVQASKVARTLGTSTLDVYRLCEHQNINKWAKFKPVQSNIIGSVHDVEHGIPYSSGIDMNIAATYDPNDLVLRMVRYEYKRPYRGLPHRIGDFWGYYHAAEAPCTIMHPITKVEMNSTGERLIIKATDQINQYNITFSDVLNDIPNFNAMEWRLSVIMTDSEFMEGVHFWTSEYAWGDGHDDRLQVVINANTLHLENGDTVGFVAMLLKTGTDWDMQDFYGFDVSMLPIGATRKEYRAIALPTVDYADYMIAEVKKNAAVENITVNFVDFSAVARKVNQIVSGTLSERYNVYEITNAEIGITVRNITENWNMLGNLSFRFELYLYDYYDVASDGNITTLSSFKSSGAETLGSNESVFEYGDTEESQNISIPSSMFMYTTYSAYDSYVYQLRVYVRYKYDASTEVLLRVINIPYKPDGTGINVNIQYND